MELASKLPRNAKRRERHEGNQPFWCVISRRGLTPTLIPSLICRRIDELRARQDLDVLTRLRTGQAVSFESREGQVFGRVIKINRKTVEVQSEDNRQWKVSASMIKLLHDVRSLQAHASCGNRCSVR